MCVHECKREVSYKTLSNSVNGVYYMDNDTKGQGLLLWLMMEIKIATRKRM